MPGFSGFNRSSQQNFSRGWSYRTIFTLTVVVTPVSQGASIMDQPINLDFC